MFVLGAATTVYCATRPVEELKTVYYADCASKVPKPYAEDSKNADHLWVKYTHIFTPIFRYIYIYILNMKNLFFPRALV